MGITRVWLVRFLWVGRLSSGLMGTEANAWEAGHVLFLVLKPFLYEYFTSCFKVTNRKAPCSRGEIRRPPAPAPLLRGGNKETEAGRGWGVSRLWSLLSPGVRQLQLAAVLGGSPAGAGELSPPLSVPADTPAHPRPERPPCEPAAPAPPRAPDRCGQCPCACGRTDTRVHPAGPAYANSN